MNYRGIILVALICIVSLSGCLLVDGSEKDDEASVRFQTSESVYQPIIVTEIAVFLNFDIATRLENTGNGDVALIGCMNPSRPLLQKWNDNGWRTVYAVAEPECISPPWYLGPGEVFEDTLLVSAVLDPNVVPEAKWDSGIPVDGLYRLERSIYRAETRSGFPQELLPESERVSQTFEVHPVHALSQSARGAWQ